MHVIVNSKGFSHVYNEVSQEYLATMTTKAVQVSPTVCGINIDNHPMRPQVHVYVCGVQPEVAAA